MVSFDKYEFDSGQEVTTHLQNKTPSMTIDVTEFRLWAPFIFIVFDWFNKTIQISGPIYQLFVEWQPSGSQSFLKQSKIREFVSL